MCANTTVPAPIIRHPRLGGCNQALRSANPARLLAREAVCAEVSPGQIANLVLFQPGECAFEVQATFLAGRQVYP